MEINEAASWQPRRSKTCQVLKPARFNQVPAENDSDFCRARRQAA